LGHIVTASQVAYVLGSFVTMKGPHDRSYAPVQELLAGWAPLDGVGFQAHLGLAPIGQYEDGPTIAASLPHFADLGLTVELT